MKAFLEEYGIAVLVVVVVFILIMIATPVGDMIKDGLLNLIGKLIGVVSDSEATPPEEATTALKMIVNNLHI